MTTGGQNIEWMAAKVRKRERKDRRWRDDITAFIGTTRARQAEDKCFKNEEIEILHKSYMVAIAPFVQGISIRHS